MAYTYSLASLVKLGSSLIEGSAANHNRCLCGLAVVRVLVESPGGLEAIMVEKRIRGMMHAAVVGALQDWKC